MLPWSCSKWIFCMFTLFDVHAFIQSGTILLSDQSPPPITFPALATTDFY